MGRHGGPLRRGVPPATLHANPAWEERAFDTGLFLLPLAIAAGVTTPIARRIADKLGPRLPLVLGFTLIAFNTWQLRDLNLNTDLGWIAVLLIIRGVAFGLVIQNSLVAALADVPVRLTARASSLTNAMMIPVTWKAPRGYWGVSHKAQIDNFYASLAAGVQPDITGEEGIKSLEMILAIYRSSREGRPVRLGQPVGEAVPAS